MDQALADFVDLSVTLLAVRRHRFIDRMVLPWEAGERVVEWRGVKLRLTCGLELGPEAGGTMSGVVRLVVRLGVRVESGELEEGSVGLDVGLDRWRGAEDYLTMPGAVYEGNRFRVRPMTYPPMAGHPDDQGPGVALTISDVPRLNLGDGPSSLRLLSGDLAVPAFGVWHRSAERGLWVRGPHDTAWGVPAYVAEESDGRDRLRLSVQAPGVRDEYRYAMCTTHYPSADRGRRLAAGDELTLSLDVWWFTCPDVVTLFDRLWSVRGRGETPAGREVPATVPLSAAYQIVEDKTRAQNWEPKYGYYRVGVGPGKANIHWQAGWIGGLMNTLPLLRRGDDQTVDRVCSTFDFVFPQGQSASGFFHGMGDGASWRGDFLPSGPDHWHLTRKSADVLYFLFLHFDVFRRRGLGHRIKDAWEEGARRCADAFVELWERERQFGQFVDTRDGSLIVGHTTAAGLAPGGLALATQYFDEPRYLRVARESAEDYLQNHLGRGLTTGGPGEIMQNADGESCFALLESMVTLHEVTGEEHWLDAARAAADQCLSWAIDYDWAWPAGSEFARLDMHSRGSLFANVQNKAGVPGICTLSGVGLLKLYRATGQGRYLDLLRDIARALPQFVSREDRPIADTQGQCMPAGWICERVNTSDWDHNVGGIFCFSCWPEVSLLLTFTEVPGVYVDADARRIWCVDHVEARLENGGVLELHNPTAFDAEVSVLVETAEDRARPLHADPLAHAQRVHVPAKETRQLKIVQANRSP